MTARTHFEPPGPVRRPKRTPPTITTRPHTVHVIGSNPAQFDILFDSGPAEPTQVINLTRDLCVQLRDAIDRKLSR